MNNYSINAIEHSLTPSNNSKSRKLAKNKLAILQTIFEVGKISINDLMRKLNISFPTLNSMLIDLTAKGLILQVERGESIGGRKPNLYELNHSLFRILTVEVDRLSVNIRYLDNNCLEKRPPHSYPYQLSQGKTYLSQLIKIIRTYLAEEKITNHDFSGIAVSIPGMVDKTLGTSYSYLYEDGFQLEKHLEFEFQKRTIVINDAKANCLAEKHYGQLNETNDALLIHLNWGISLGIISNGQLYQGKNGFAGELGHISFKEEGKLCYCGKRGCLETIVSGSALVDKAKQDIATGMPTVLTEQLYQRDLQPQHIIQAAINGDQYAIQLISMLGNKLGKALAQIIQIFNPEVILISGEFAKASAFINGPIIQQLQAYSMSRISNNCELLASQLGDQATAIGLMRHFVKKYFEEKNSNN